MIKLIYSTAFDEVNDVSMRIVNPGTELRKSASELFTMEYDDMAPDKDHVGIHVTAVGAFEKYGQNRNGDAFSRKACVDYHDTFVKYGAVFRHHRNHDRNNNLGLIKASAYNPHMERIELYIHANKDRAQDELHRLEKEGEIPFSMAAKVAFDRCNICNTIRKNASDPNQCDHVKYELGKMAEDGTIVCTHNDEPRFFDISFVGRPADRIAWQLKVAADGLLDSIELAEQAGIHVPVSLDDYAYGSNDKRDILEKLAMYQETYARWLAPGIKQASIKTSRDKYLFSLLRATSTPLSDSTVAELRSMPVKTAMYTLAKAGTVMDVETFFKYALGGDYNESKTILKEVKAAVPVVMGKTAGSYINGICSDPTFDVNLERTPVRTPRSMQKLAYYSTVGALRDSRIIDNVVSGLSPEYRVDSQPVIGDNTREIESLAEKYAAYKVSAVDAILKLHRNTDVDSVVALAAAQNFLV